MRRVHGAGYDVARSSRGYVVTFPLPHYTPDDLPFHADGYDRRRDNLIDFPDAGEPTTDEVKYTAYTLYVNTGETERRYGDE